MLSRRLSPNQSKPRLPNPLDQRVGSARIELVISRHCIQWGQIVQEIHRFDHLLAIPDLAFQRRIKEVAAVQNAYVVSIRLHALNERRDPAEAATTALFHCVNPIGVVQMNERQDRVGIVPRLRSAAGGDKENRKKNQASNWGHCRAIRKANFRAPILPCPNPICDCGWPLLTCTESWILIK